MQQNSWIICNAYFASISEDKKIRNTVQNTENDNRCNGEPSSLNRIKRSSLVRSDDAVETFKRHAYDEPGAAYDRYRCNDSINGTIILLIKREI